MKEVESAIARANHAIDYIRKANPQMLTDWNTIAIEAEFLRSAAAVIVDHLWEGGKYSGILEYKQKHKPRK